MRSSSNVEISSGVTNSFGEDKDRLQFEHELFMQEVVSIRRRLREQLEAISAKRKLEKAAARKAKKATASVSNEDDVRGSDPKDAKGGEVEGEKDKGEESEQVSRVG
jgi:DNA-binding PucR family transcriptional regulator